MTYEWDERKRLSNVRKHGIDFADVSEIFAGVTVTLLDDRSDYGEDRLVTLGILGGQVVAVVHTESETSIRVISARKATRHEEENYFKQVAD